MTVADALRAAADGRVPPNVGLMRALAEAESPAAIDAALAVLRAEVPPEACGRLDAVGRLWAANPDAWSLVRRVLGAANHDPVGSAATPARWAATFDRLAATAPDAGMALYALGNADLLERVTYEVVERLAGWGLLGPERDAIEIGCGNGRFVRALSPKLRSVAGLDVSGALVVAARTRCAGLPNVRLEHTDGRGLGVFADRSADLVLAVDVFPYLLLGGSNLATVHWAEAARVLRSGGSLVILNYSYRGDPVRDRADVDDLACRFGFQLRRAATGDFALWDGATFWLDKQEGSEIGVRSML